LVRLSNKGSKLSRFCYVFPEIHSGLLLIKNAINNSIVKYRYLILRLDDILNKLHGSYMFSKIYLKIDYHQIKMKKDDKGKDNFKNIYELFECLVMLFSLTITYSNIIRLMNHILCAFIGSFIVD